MYNSISSGFKKVAAGVAAISTAATLSVVPALARGTSDAFSDGLNKSTNNLDVQGGSLIGNLTGILNGVFLFLGFVAVIFIIWSGISIITSKDNEEKLKKAQKYVINAVIGFVLIALSWTIVGFILSLVASGTDDTATSNQVKGIESTQAL